LTLACAGLLQSRGSGLGLLKSTLNVKISHAGCLGLSPAISSQFSVEMCAAPKNCEKNSLKTPFGEVQGHSRSPILINLKSLSLVLVMISSMYVLICNRFHIIRANNGKMTSFLGGTPLRRACSRGTPAPSGTKFCHDKLRDLGGSQRWRFRDPSLHRFDTDHKCDGRTDRQTEGQTPRRWLRRAKHSAVARKNWTYFRSRGKYRSGRPNKQIHGTDRFNIVMVEKVMKEWGKMWRAGNLSLSPRVTSAGPVDWPTYPRLTTFTTCPSASVDVGTRHMLLYDERYRRLSSSGYDACCFSTPSHSSCVVVDDSCACHDSITALASL